MPRATAPIPPITVVSRDLTVAEVATIIDMAERAQQRRRELAAAMRAALTANDQTRVTELARQMCGLEEQIEE